MDIMFITKITFPIALIYTNYIGTQGILNLVQLKWGSPNKWQSSRQLE